MGATNGDMPIEVGEGRRAGPKCCAKKALCSKICGQRPRINILDNATGQAKMGELVGVLGPSGAPLLLDPYFVFFVPPLQFPMFR